jgi:apolipoprotein N-acyltransferase
MLVAGWLYGLAFPPAALRWTAWIALAPVVVVARRATTTTGAAAFGAVFAIAGTIATVDWLPRTVAVYYGQPLVVGLALFAAVTLLMVVPPVAAFAAATRVLGDAPAWARAPLVASAWIATELWRAHALGGNPWVLLGYSQVGATPVVQLADLGGVYAVGFVVALVNAALAEVALLVAGRVGRRDALQAATVAVAIVAAALGYATATRPHESADDTKTMVAVVQGNLDLGSQWQEDFYGRNLDSYLRLTQRALAQYHPRLVVWPEAAMTFFIDRERLYRAAIAHVIGPAGAELVSGGPHVADEAAQTFYNSAFALDPSGTIGARYDKERLLPFAEYFPFERLDFVRRSFGRVRSFVPGDPPAPLPTAAGAAGVLICNEALFPELARARVRSGAELLLVLTNDTWVGDRKFAGIASDMAVLRAIETRRWVVRASTSGPSIVVDPAGTVVASTAYDTASSAGAPVSARGGLTPYVRVGDAFAMACVAFAIGGVGWIALRPRG